MATATATKRPDMRDYFKGQIDWHTNGMFARPTRIPHGVRRVNGDVTDRLITVVTDDGTEFRWAGGRYASRKVRGCYAPLMPTPIND